MMLSVWRYVWIGQDLGQRRECGTRSYNTPTTLGAYLRRHLGHPWGGCEADEDADGICDDIDTCIGGQNGVCNGPGPTEVVIENITILYDSVYAEPIDQWFVFEVGADTTFAYTCAPYCGDLVSYQGYDYATVLIGEQCWFAENLRNENYDNGDAIPTGLSDGYSGEWQATTSGAVAMYGEESTYCYNYSPDGEACDEAWSLNEYGRLYNWYAVDDARGLCPSGWHVPTDGEWMTMEMALGMSEARGEQHERRGTDQGTQMKTDYGWYSGGNGTNTSGFSGLPGGERDEYGWFDGGGAVGKWWSSSPDGDGAWGRSLTGSEQVWRNSYDVQKGRAIRCILDAD